MVSWLELVGVDKTADAAILFALSNEKSLRKALTMNAPDKCVGMRVCFTYTIKQSPYVCPQVSMQYTRYRYKFLSHATRA